MSKLKLEENKSLVEKEPARSQLYLDKESECRKECRKELITCEQELLPQSMLPPTVGISPLLLHQANIQSTVSSASIKYPSRPLKVQVGMKKQILVA